MRKIDIDKQELFDLYVNQKVPLAECGRILGTTNRKRLRELLSDMGIETNKKPKKVAYEFDFDKAKELHKSGKTIKEVAEYFNAPSERIRKDMIEGGYEFSMGKIDVPDREILVDLYWNQNLNMSDIAKKYDTTTPTVKKWLEEHNIDRRSHSEDISLVLKGNSAFSRPEVQEKAIKSKFERYGKIGNPDIKSNQEEEVREYLNSLKPENDFKTEMLNGFELDGRYNNLAFEYCGIYYHCEKFREDKNYHYRKTKESEETGIRLITIFSDEWLYKNEQIKGFLKSIAGNPDRTYYGRNLDSFYGHYIHEDTKSLLHLNHIQGYSNNIKYMSGLLNGSELLGVMTFGRHHRQNSSEKSIVLNRFAIKNGVHIPGGASKMMKPMIKFLRNEGYEKIISWSDNRYTQGNVYEKLGFEMTKEYGPDYSYVDLGNPKKRISKQKMQKRNIGCPAHITEREFCLENGFYRIWDCGKKVWEMSLV